MPGEQRHDQEAAGGTPKCPDCLIEFSSFETLGRHMERHAPVSGPTHSPRGKLLSVACPRACGRHFLGMSKLRDHARRCNGEPPLAAVPVATVPATLPFDKARGLEERDARVPASETAEGTSKGTKEANMPKCGLCDKEFNTDHGLEVHKARKHKAAGGAAVRKPKRRKSPKRRAPPAAARALAAAPSGDGAEIVETLRAKARGLRERADKLEELAEQAQGLF